MTVEVSRCLATITVEVRGSLTAVYTNRQLSDDFLWVMAYYIGNNTAHLCAGDGVRRDFTLHRSNSAGSYMGLGLKPYQIVKRSGERTNIKSLP